MILLITKYCKLCFLFLNITVWFLAVALMPCSTWKGNHLFVVIISQFHYELGLLMSDLLVIWIKFHWICYLDIG